jgi:hypothetical protein
MEIDEIRLKLAEARRCCADARSTHAGRDLNRQEIAKLIESLDKLEEVTDWLFAERDAFAGRLARRSATRPVEIPAITNIQQSEAGISTPSPAPDA